jgi:hypothetical protein
VFAKGLRGAPGCGHAPVFSNKLLRDEGAGADGVRARFCLGFVILGGLAPRRGDSRRAFPMRKPIAQIATWISDYV